MPAIQHKKANIGALIIEITRRCNMKCEHCMRGAAQPRDITTVTLERLLRPIRAIDTLTFTGGEPSLKPDIMMQALDICKRYHVVVNKVYLVTNGKKVTDEFLDAVMAWHKYTVLCAIGRSDRMVSGDDAAHFLRLCSERDYDSPGCTVALSMDPYHSNIPVENIIRLSCLPRLVDDKYEPDRNYDRWVISEGRAAANGLGKETLPRMRPWYFKPEGTVLDIDDLDCDEVSIDEVTCNALGDILKTCDASYVTQRKIRHFNMDKLRPNETWVDRSVARKAYFDKTDKIPPKGLTAYGLVK